LRFTFPRFLQEAALDAEAAERRLALLKDFPVLDASPQGEGLAQTYSSELGLPDRAVRDAAHLAFATLSKWITF
jgi:hypothetical protein